ncbi:hypothetical protein [Halocalculus aciditolerans]|uniref:DUF8054 domain-containing protein n=1 Tax=Halocalculus aciditolerans TaxID=1383812 RepID=A0A830FD68_9EURY|nr:hypothetical protein [Halocalculus aciditolerans]GGL63399.1 hypothetical protein GCM10009039_21640 [Halocalculus aciditolerans]
MTLVFSRVLDDPGVCLDRALADAFTGVAAFEARAALVGDASDTYDLAFEDGVPTRAAARDADAAGPPVLSRLAEAAPCRVELRADATRSFRSDATVDPPAVARALDRDRLVDQYPASPESDPETGPDADESSPDPDAVNVGETAAGAEPAESVDALEAFLADEERVDALRERAREEAVERADEWGFEVSDAEGRE